MTNTQETEAPRKATRLDGDSRVLVIVVVSLVIGLGLTSFVAGVPGLMAAGRLARLVGWEAFLPAILVDGSLVTFSLVSVIRRSRHESSRFSWACLAVLTTLSVALQAVHALGTGPLDSGRIIGAIVAASFPLTVLVSTHAVVLLGFSPPVKSGRRVARSAGKAPMAKAATVAAGSVATQPAIKPATAGAIQPDKVTTRQQAKEQVRTLHDAGLSQRAIAAAVGYSRPTIVSWLREN